MNEETLEIPTKSALASRLTELVRGHAQFIDDMPHIEGLLHAAVVTSNVAHAVDVSIEPLTLGIDEPYSVLITAQDIPGENSIGPVVHDEPCLAREEIHYYGAPLAIVVAESHARAQALARRVKVHATTQPAILNLEQAERAQSFFQANRSIVAGDFASAFAASSHQIHGTTSSGAQEHFYLETQIAQAQPLDDGGIEIWSSSQHPAGVQKCVARVLGLGLHQVVVKVARLGGGFGGKETQAEGIAALAALAAFRCRRPVRLRLPRHQDVQITGKRHPFIARYAAGFDSEGHVLALKVDLIADGGYSLDLSSAILERALFHLDNAYFLPNLIFSGKIARTNLPSNTAFRGFGGPQGMFVIESVLEEIAAYLKLDPALVRQRNFYRDPPPHSPQINLADMRPTDCTPYGASVRGWTLPAVWQRLLASSDYQARRAEIEASWTFPSVFRRGIAITPVKFGISFTTTHLNQASALVVAYPDGSVQINHGATEMGQGVLTKLEGVVARFFSLAPQKVRTLPTATDKIPNASATAASSSTDLNGGALLDACTTLLSRLRMALAQTWDVDLDSIDYDNGILGDRTQTHRPVNFGQACELAWLARISLLATGSYATPEIHFDRERGRGQPFYYYACGACVAEVLVDLRSGRTKSIRVDIVHDVGESLNTAIDRGQIEGGFIQGLGWIAYEEVVLGAQGNVRTSGPSTYKIPTVDELAADFRVELFAGAPGRAIYGSKAVGEPPLMLALAHWSAIVHATSAIQNGRTHVGIDLPATPERILRAIVGEPQP
jgi:xanthine dehydrogenase large subunit